MIVDYSQLPDHMQEGAQLYVEQGVEPGDFMQAVLSNDLVAAFGRADEVNSLRMKDWVKWLYNECPRAAWGSREQVEHWLAAGGMGVE